MIKFLFCTLILAAIYFMGRGFLSVADEVRGIDASAPAHSSHVAGKKAQVTHF